MSVLLVACPCAIGLATPVVIWSALARLGERGVVVRSGDAIERFATVDRVLFDKTGTLTEDRFAVVEIETAPGINRATLLSWVALIQEHSAHPLARPFADLSRPFASAHTPDVVLLATVPGSGVAAELADATGVRHTIQIGTPEWLPGELNWSRQLSGSSARLVHVTLDGTLAAVAVVAERIRDSTPAALTQLVRLGLPVEILSGDRSARLNPIGWPRTQTGLLPDDKRRLVEAARDQGGKPLFVGDGINDASALATAHIGVALASGSELAITAAPATLYTSDLRVIPWAIVVSREAVWAVRWNLMRAVAYNLIGMALAACGVLHPVVAALLMVLSSLTLLFSSSRVGSCELAEEAAPPPAAEPSLPKPSASGLRAAAHGLALGLQGVVCLLLLERLREPVLAGLVLSAFSIVGATLAVIWRSRAIPHWLDMCFGMITLGNLGMLLGWWADNGLAPLRDHGCCACAELIRDNQVRPWMWIGMIAFANVAMIKLGRTPMPGGRHTLAMLTGGNAGMIGGMILGGWCSELIDTGDVLLSAGLGFAGMTAGMLASMLAGTWIAERLLNALRALGLAPVWRRFNSTRTA
jgi:soluble P-type ATPase